MEVTTSGKRRAYESDWLANKYAEGSPGHLLPQVQSSDNGSLDRITLKKINWALEKCFEIKSGERATAEELLGTFYSWASVDIRQSEVYN
jgi:hypothetical protein